MPDTLKNAKNLLNLHIGIIPLRHRGKEPEARLIGGSWEVYNTRLTTEQELGMWLSSGWQNYGVVCGWDNLTVIDFDNEEAFEIWLRYADVLFRHGVFETPYMVKTRRGAHVYIRTPAMRENGKRRGVDIQASHKYVVGAGSTHPSGAIYTQITDMVFPVVWDINTILPLDLFPVVTPEEIQTTPEPLPVVVNDDYDPFLQASQIATGSPTTGDLVKKVKSSMRIENWFPQAQKSSSKGNWYAVRCLFHQDQHASAWIDTQRQLYGCQVCGMKPMDVINLYARTHGISDRDAILEMAKSL